MLHTLKNMLGEGEEGGDGVGGQKEYLLNSCENDDKNR